MQEETLSAVLKELSFRLLKVFFWHLCTSLKFIIELNHWKTEIVIAVLVVVALRTSLSSLLFQYYLLRMCIVRKKLHWKCHWNKLFWVDVVPKYLKLSELFMCFFNLEEIRVVIQQFKTILIWEVKMYLHFLAVFLLCCSMQIIQWYFWPRGF